MWHRWCEKYLANGIADIGKTVNVRFYYEILSKLVLQYLNLLEQEWGGTTVLRKQYDECVDDNTQIIGLTFNFLRLVSSRKALFVNCRDAKS